ncbi:MAG: extracellular solute-binding protein [Galactobacter sp.]
MSKFSWRTGFAAVAAVGALTLTSCGFGGDDSGDDDAKGGTTTLQMLVPTYSDQTKGLWEDIIKDFEAEHDDIKINLETQSWDNLETVLKTKIQSKKAPDIYNGGAISGYVGDGILAKAEDIASKDTLENFQDSFADAEKVGGAQYGLPFIASDRALFYNKDLMKEAGVKDVPKTWDELLSASKAIKDKTGNPGYGMPLGSEEAQAEAMLWAVGNGGSFGDEENITVDDPKNVEAFDQMKKMIDSGATQANPGSTQRTPMMSGFVQGKMGFVYALPQTMQEIEKTNPDLNYGIAQPATKDGSAVTLGVGDRLASFSQSEAKQKAVTEFMDFFFSDEQYQNFVEKEGFLPTTKSASEKMASDEDLKPFLDLLPDAQFYPTTNPAWSATDGAFKSLMGKLQSSSGADVARQIQAKADAAS